MRKKRLDLGLLQREVAYRLGVDTNSVTNWGKNRYTPSLHLMPKVIEFLGYMPILPSAKTADETVVTLRRLLGTPQENLAQLLGEDPSTLGRWEGGQ